jgi:1,4-dihydroxy-2-naphthoate octaprenyltransferase
MAKQLKLWFLETRPQFLLLSVVLVLLGSAMSYHDGHFHWLRFLLTTLGLVLAHASVNILNDYWDYKSGIDIATIRTPFSGGSGLLPAKLLEPEGVYKFGVGCLLTALVIGIYLTIVSGWLVLPLIVIGGVVIYFYTCYLTKWMAGELWAGLGLGTLPVLGTYFVQTGSYSSEALVASLAPGFLTANLLLLNEFPDYAADREAGRYHIVIALGKTGAGWVYAALMAFTYISIIVGVACRIMPPLTLIALLTIPFALKAINTAFKHHDELEKMISAMGANVITVLATDALLAVGYLGTRFL